MVFAKLLKDIRTGDILDVGCGSGQFTEILAECLGSFTKVTGVDVDETALAEARNKFTDGKFLFRHISGMGLPFEDSTFDMVVISKALHHVPDPGGMLGEMYRVLSPGGFFMINEMHRNELSPEQESHKLYHHLRSDIDRIAGISHNHTFLREDLIRLFNSVPLTGRIVTEYIPDSGEPHDPEQIREYTGKMESWINLPGMQEDHPDIKRRMQDLKARFHTHGIARPPQLVMMGKK